jgi:hypothetical protein
MTPQLPTPELTDQAKLDEPVPLERELLTSLLVRILLITDADNSAPENASDRVGP